MSELLTKIDIRRWIESLLAEGKRVAGPQRIKSDLVQYAWLGSPDQLTLDGFIRPANSIKEFVFPRHEKLYAYRFVGKQIELSPVEPPIKEQIIIGARPCDAAALTALDRIFNWDTQDEFYNRRRELTTVVTLACGEFDSHCFCTSVGIGPGDPRGSDALLIPIDGDKYEVRCLTEKGRRLFAGVTTESTEEGAIIEGPKPQFNLEALGEFLVRGYDDPAWQTAALRCLGCGACAYTCPTCHCFDIVDEGGPSGGTRVRNWDACQFPMFTMHASGHNPRSDQAQRQRQRIYHKFQIYPEKFGELLCTGCGNCARSCPAGLGVLPVLKTIAATSNSATK
jgi:ferredoxin